MATTTTTPQTMQQQQQSAATSQSMTQQQPQQVAATTSQSMTQQQPQTQTVKESLDLVMLEGKVAVVLGSAGVAGQKAVEQLLGEGASKVVIVADSEEKKKALMDRYPNEVKQGRLVGVLGKYETRKNLEEILQEVKKALGPNINIDHIVSSFDYKSEKTTTTSKGDVSQMRAMFDEAFFPTMLAADVFMPELRLIPGSTFTVFDEPFLTQPFGSVLWPRMVTGAATNAYLDLLAMEYPSTRVSLRRMLREA